MAATAAARRPATAQVRTAPAADSWPHTGRVLPWILAVFVVMLWVTPIAAMRLPIPLPVEPRPDRLLLIALAGAWLATSLMGRTRPSDAPASIVHWALGLFALCVLVGLLLRWPQATVLGESAGAVKKLFLLLAYGAFFVLVTSTIRPREVPAFLKLTAVLAAIVGAGALVEYVAKTNVFYDSAKLIFPGVSVEFAPAGTVAGRRVVVGPTQHGLALTAILAMALPLTVVFAARARTLWPRVGWGLAIGLIIAGAIATSRKTSLIAPVVAVLVFACYRPRLSVRLLPALLLSVCVVVLLAAEPLQTAWELLGGSSTTDALSTQGRLSDFEAVRPDVLSNLLLGRGYGTYDPAIYRILDNTMLGLVVSVGFLGLWAFLLIIASITSVAHRVATRARDGLRADLGAAIAASAMAFAVVCLLFDATGFAQVPYLLMFLAACAVVMARQDTVT